MKPSLQFIIYVLGLIPLGLFYEPIKEALGGRWLFLAFGVAYLVGLRLIGSLVARTAAMKRA